MNRRQWAAALAAAIAVPAGLVGCANLGPRQVTLSEADLQTLLERQFPLQRRLLEVIDVDIALPVLRLLPERKRIATELELRATERLSGRTVRGSLALDYALRYEPSDASVRLTQVRVQAAQLDLGSGPLAPSAARVGALLAERLLDDAALWRADAQRLRLLQRAGVAAADIDVSARGIEIRFVEPR